MKRQKPEEQISQHCQTIQSYSAGTSNNKRTVDLTLRLETHLIISINYAFFSTTRVCPQTACRSVQPAYSLAHPQTVHAASWDVSNNSSPHSTLSSQCGLKVLTVMDFVYRRSDANKMMKVSVPPTKKSTMMMNRNRSMIAAASIQSFISCSSLSFSLRWRLMVLTIDCSRSRISASTGSVPRSTRSAASPCGADDDEDGDSFGRRLQTPVNILGASSRTVSSVSTL